MPLEDQPPFVYSVSLKDVAQEKLNEFPFSLPAIRGIEKIELHPRVTFLVGENGSGKSTLMEALAISLRMNAEGGTRNFNFSTNSTHSSLWKYLRVAKSYRRPRNDFFSKSRKLLQCGNTS